MYTQVGLWTLTASLAAFISKIVTSLIFCHVCNACSAFPHAVEKQDGYWQWAARFMNTGCSHLRASLAERATLAFLTHAHAQRGLLCLPVYLMYLSVCLSVTLHLTSGASVRLEIDITYLTGNEGQKIVGISLKLLRCWDPALLAVLSRPFFAMRKNHACACHAFSQDP